MLTPNLGRAEMQIGNDTVAAAHFEKATQTETDPEVLQQAWFQLGIVRCSRVGALLVFPERWLELRHGPRRCAGNVPGEHPVNCSNIINLKGAQICLPAAPLEKDRCVR